ncbi:MAG: CSLREA domain-containing protein, partial [Chloroflexota bacterium]
MKTKVGLCIMTFAFCLIVSPIKAEATFGPWLLEDLLISTTIASGDPAAVAFDGLNYLVVWSQLTDYQEETFLLDVYGRLVNKAGEPITDPFPIVAKPANQSQPDVAFNGTYYLVVWKDNHGSHSWDTINGRAVAIDGTTLGSEQVISTASHNSRSYPAVASDGTDFMVVWQDNNNYHTTFGDILGRQVHINETGQAIPGDLFWFNMRPGEQFFPAIGFGGGRYLVTWSEEEVPSTQAYDVLAMLVNPLTLAVETIIPVSTAPSWQGSRPAGIAYGTGLFLVVFDDHRHGGYYTAVYGARITKNGLLLDGPPESGGIPISTNAGPGGPHAPQAAYANGEWLVAWAGPAIRGARITTKGTVLDVNGIALSPTAVSQFAPALAAGGDGYLVTWQHNPSFTKYAQAVGYSQSGNILMVNSTADPGDGVCTPTDCTLREAIIAANNMFGPVTIYLPAGNITLAVPGRGEDGALWGDLDITNELIIIGKGQMATIIDGGQFDRIIHVLPGANVILAQMTIRNGLAGDGGGILNEGTLTLKQCTVSGNQVSYNLPEGSGNNSGGGILNLGTLQIVNSTITNNSTDRLMGDGPGGGIQNKGTLIVNKTIFSHNWAAGGAGIYNDGGVVSVKSGTFNNNGVRFFGGALLNRSPGIFTVDRSIIQNNIESVYNAGSMNITNSTIRDNEGYRVVGGIFNDNGTLYISGSTLAYNTGLRNVAGRELP